MSETGNRTETTGERSPEQIREEIEQTREELGETVAAAAEKADVKKQAQAKVEDAKGQAKAKVEDLKAAAPESPQEGLRQAQDFARDNPKPLAIAGAVLALFLLWRLVRS